jgi:hypothetical protein
MHGARSSSLRVTQTWWHISTWMCGWGAFPLHKPYPPHLAPLRPLDPAPAHMMGCKTRTVGSGCSRVLTSRENARGPVPPGPALVGGGTQHTTPPCAPTTQHWGATAMASLGSGTATRGTTSAAMASGVPWGESPAPWGAGEPLGLPGPSSSSSSADSRIGSLGADQPTAFLASAQNYKTGEHIGQGEGTRWLHNVRSCRQVRLLAYITTTPEECKESIRGPGLAGKSGGWLASRPSAE